ncbi:hypothetical protein BAE44_0024506 [Dichanthelium oligosanthes]|uniref:Uncharacterized protein n=1 Tax=Dichanthelium oligosanthes TaxID=888268 RepID=A0A1E5UNU2_9POAL|nr:hypothetical protein BAE44_0024506 [Dichanthelium oligosanthes]
MWEMLGNTKTSTGSAGGGGAMSDGTAGKGKASRRARIGRTAAVAWSRLASYCCFAL